MTQIMEHRQERSEKLSETAARVAGKLRRPSLAPVRIAVMVGALDLALFGLGFWFVAFALSPKQTFAPLTWGLWAGAAAVGAVATLVILKAYRLPFLGSTLKSWNRVAVATVLPGAAIAWGANPHADPSDATMVVAVAMAIAVLPTRAFVAAGVAWALDSGLTERRAVIVGGGENAEVLMRGLAARPGNDIRICAIFDDRSGDRSPDVVLEVPKIGRFDDLLEFARRAEIDLVIITLPLEAEARIGRLLSQFRVLPLPVHLSAFSRDFAFRGSAPRDVALITALPASYRPERRLLKRGFDLIFGTLALVLLSPVMALAALAIRLDSPGPVLFRQVRHGFNDGAIEVLKFRSMYSESCDPEARQIVTRGDPRVTRVGRFLRKTSLDELPQLFNVLGGTLSLVGPRPHALDACSSRQERFNQIVDGYSARHRLPPGITGWAQINGWRGEIDDPEKLRERFAHDLFYIENWSLWLDLVILLKTPFCLFDTRRAY